MPWWLVDPLLNETGWLVLEYLESRPSPARPLSSTDALAARHPRVTWSSPSAFGPASPSVISSQKSVRPLTVKPSNQLRTAATTPSGVAAVLTGWSASPFAPEPEIRALRPPPGSLSSHTLTTRTPLRSFSSKVTPHRVWSACHGIVAYAYGDRTKRKR